VLFQSKKANRNIRVGFPDFAIEKEIRRRLPNVGGRQRFCREVEEMSSDSSK